MTVETRGLELVELPVQPTGGEGAKLGATVCVFTHHTVRDATEAQKLAQNGSEGEPTQLPPRPAPGVASLCIGISATK